MLDHELEIVADAFVPADSHLTLLGRIESVAGTGEDFRGRRRLGDAMPGLFANHGSLYRLRYGNSPGGAQAFAARLTHPASRRAINVFTTESYLQLCTGSQLDGSILGKSGCAYDRFAGRCLSVTVILTESTGLSLEILYCALMTSSAAPRRMRSRIYASSSNALSGAQPDEKQRSSMLVLSVFDLWGNLRLWYMTVPCRQTNLQRNTTINNIFISRIETTRWPPAQ